MGVDLKQEQRGAEGAQAPAMGGPRPSLIARVRTALLEVQWGLTMLLALAMAVAWCSLFLSTSWLQVLAGVVPVMAGLYLGRRVKGQYLAHGLALGFGGFIIGFLIILAYGGLGASGLVPLPQLALEADQPPQVVTPGELIFFYLAFSAFALIPFPAFGTVMGGRAEQRNRDLQAQVAERGGRLERPGVIRTREDLLGLSLPQLGSYITALYRKKGFEFKDYRFIDKDKHLDIEMTYQGQTYLLRMSVADKVRPGTVESLVQDMKRREIPRGVVITTTEFTPDTIRAVEARRNLVGIDGQTLFDIAEK